MTSKSIRLIRAVARRLRPAPPTEIIPKKKIARYLPAKPVIVEAGAAEGFDTMEMKALWPQATIHAFEPVPALLERLRAATKNLSDVTVYPYALDSQTGRRSMFLSGGRSVGSSSLLPPKFHLVQHPDVTFETSIEVDTIRLDEWAAANDVHHVDLLWLDLQGNELPVLEGAGELLQGCAALHLEVNLKETYEGAALYPELKEWLLEQDFVPVVEALPWPDAGNVLFARRSL